MPCDLQQWPGCSLPLRLSDRTADEIATSEGTLPNCLAKLVNCLGTVLLDRGGKSPVSDGVLHMVESTIPLLHACLLAEDDAVSEQVLEFAGLYTQFFKVRMTLNDINWKL